MSWQLLTAISVLCLSASVLVQRVILQKGRTDPYAYAVTFQAIVGGLLMLAALINGFTLEGLHVVWIPAALSIVLFGIGHIFYAKSLQLVEASAFSVLFATQAIWIMLAGILLLSESLNVWQIVGTGLIFVSLLLSSNGLKHFTFDKGMVLGLFTGLLFGIAITSWSFAGRFMDVLSWAAVSFLGTAVVVLLIKPAAAYKVEPLLSGSLLTKLIILGALYGAGSLAMLYAYNAGTLAEVTPVRQTSIVVTTLLAIIILKNERTRIPAKLFAALLSFVGVLLIVI